MRVVEDSAQGDDDFARVDAVRGVDIDRVKLYLWRDPDVRTVAGLNAKNAGDEGAVPVLVVGVDSDPRRPDLNEVAEIELADTGVDQSDTDTRTKPTAMSAASRLSTFPSLSFASAADGSVAATNTLRRTTTTPNSEYPQTACTRYPAHHTPAYPLEGVHHPGIHSIERRRLRPDSGRRPTSGANYEGNG